MRKKTLFAVITVAACVVVAAGGLLASNMGFKLNYRLNTTTPGVSLAGKNTLSLPYFRQTGMNDSIGLILDIGGGTVTPVASVSRYNELTDAFAVYTGRMGTPAPNFALTAGEGYFVSMTSSLNYIVVGSHDPSLQIQLETTTPGVSAAGKNLVATPYNITSTNSIQMMLDIGGGTVTPVASVSRYNPITDAFQVYTGRMGTPAPVFALAPGEAYFVSMNSTIAWTPSHY
jgi:hypothetical protein